MSEQRFVIERGDVLLSIQMILTLEEETRARAPRGADAPAPRTAQLHRAALPARPPVGNPIPRRESAKFFVRPTAPAVTRMVDVLTGAGTTQALRRDLQLDRSLTNEGPGRSTLVALAVDGLDQIRLAMGAEAGDVVLKSLVEVAPFALQARDRIYRSGRSEMLLLLPGVDQAGVEAAREGMESALSRVLADRGYPELKLSVRPVDPLAVAS